MLAIKVFRAITKFQSTALATILTWCLTFDYFLYRSICKIRYKLTNVEYSFCSYIIIICKYVATLLCVCMHACMYVRTYIRTYACIYASYNALLLREINLLPCKDLYNYIVWLKHDANNIIIAMYTYSYLHIFVQ